jgi:fumarylpyruvate hydrolase
MKYVFEPSARPALPIIGSEVFFPVRRIFCVARNYAAHAREMGADPNREPPFFFSKPADAISLANQGLPFPPATNNLHHEIELVAALTRGGTEITVENAMECVFGYAIGLDLTRRDLQEEAKKQGRPWDMAKGFDRSAPISPLYPAASIGHPSQGAITLVINGVEKQRGDLSDMIWSIAEIIAHLSRLVELAPGDLIFTGTPEGVGAIKPGDSLKGVIDGVGELAVKFQ